MKIFTFLAVMCSTLLIVPSAFAQEAWPKSFTTADGTVIKMYQFQPESFADNTLKGRAAISVLESGKTDPVFGVAWFKATTVTNGQQVQIQSARINSIKLPGNDNDDKLDDLAETLESQMEQWHITVPLSDLQTDLDANKQQIELSKEIKNTPPKILYSTAPSILVLIDGAPKIQNNSEWGVEAVVNTPFAIVKQNDGQFYLYGGKHWYVAPAATGPYNITTSVPQNFSKVAQSVNDANKNNTEDDGKETDANTIYKVVVSTEPAELIQSKGEANFSAVEGTNLLYVSNTDDDIFMDVNSQSYYVLISGRWYHSKTLSGNWQYVASDELPKDFASIPEGSPKDNVLASVAGTAAAKDALEDAQVPQTAKVDRNSARAEVVYDGDPEFDAIDGTEMAYAVNTPASVIRWRGRYYSVDNGIWFESGRASGPWVVSVTRPYVVAYIPPRYPVYYMKYVYIYDVGPDYVYMGYTPGYLNAYVYGPTIVYGTGYYYRPWYGHYYYPRPCTWGYGVRYNPWYGWGIGFGYSNGWLNFGFGWGSNFGYGYGSYGWWGPRSYRPSYCYDSYGYRGGYYGYNSYRSYNSYNSRGRGGRNINIVNINVNNNNIYRNRRGVQSQAYQRNFNSYNRNGNGRQRWADNNNRGGYNNNNRNRFEPNGQSGNRYDNGNRSGRRSNEANNNNTASPGRRERNNTSGDNGTWRRNNNDNGRNNNTDNPGRISSPRGNEEPRRTYERRENNNTVPQNGEGRPNRIFRRENSGGGGNENPGRPAQPQTVDRPRAIDRPQGGNEAPRRTYERREAPREQPVQRERVERSDNGGNRQFGGGNGGGRRESGGGNSGGNGGGVSRPSRGDGGNGGGNGGGGGRGRRG